MGAAEQSEFDAWVEEEVADVTGQFPRDFAALTAGLPGIYPQDVLQALQRLSRRGPNLQAVSEALVMSARHQAPTPAAPSGVLGLLPPHPLDFEWRFAPGALATLTEEIAAVTPNAAAVALVGTPTLAATPLPALKPYLVDYFGLDAGFLVSRLRVTHLRHVGTVDLLHAFRVATQYATVVMDPPWYEDYTRRFFYFAARALVIGGHLLMAMPPRGTRPGIGAANRELLSWAEQLGFVLERTQHGVIPYETPFFERNALRAAGILNVGSDWRHGDLWILRKAAMCFVPWPGDIDCAAWQEFTFGPVRLRVDCVAQTSGSEPWLQSIVDGDVLPSVSRRDSRRRQVRVWTTGNRVYACDAPADFASMISNWQRQHHELGALNDAHRRAREHFFELIDRERAELAWPSRRTADRETD